MGREGNPAPFYSGYACLATTMLPADLATLVTAANSAFLSNCKVAERGFVVAGQGSAMVGLGLLYHPSHGARSRWLASGTARARCRSPIESVPIMTGSCSGTCWAAGWGWLGFASGYGGLRLDGSGGVGCRPQSCNDLLRRTK